jgi:hypothetical protein
LLILLHAEKIVGFWIFLPSYIQKTPNHRNHGTPQTDLHTFQQIISASRFGSSDKKRMFFRKTRCT